ncbi:transcriptional regulator [Arenicella chitinivorans]|uniref:Transcriptional regulator n=1 Tax=Arenicella chitinivorans TaxID=1329800 RepID=A0A918RTS9_9GAMM|nr:AraC family transcriptional regulator [Arenicella chitinivorans]GHA12514.1 transcriptional regulator [Arenicella chitinivorans]
MNPLIDVYSLRPVNVVEVVFMTLCLFGIILLWSKPRFRGICLLFGLEIILMVFNFSEETQLFSQGYLITPALTLTTGPAFYLFVKHLVFEDHRWAANQLIHFVPTLIALFFTEHTAAVIALGSISLLIYGVLAYRFLLRYRVASHQSSAAAREMRLDWLVTIMLAFAVLGVTDIVRLNLQSLMSYPLANTWYLLHQVCVLVLFAALAILAVRQPILFDGLSRYDTSDTTDNIDTQVYRSLFQSIHQTIVDQALHRRPRLSLNDLAELTQLNTRDISAAVNIGAERSFCDYINQLRVEDVKQQLAALDNSTPNLLNIAMQAGFNSKSSFNAVFKTVTGLTPRQFHRQLQRE